MRPISHCFKIIEKKIEIVNRILELNLFFVPNLFKKNTFFNILSKIKTKRNVYFKNCYFLFK